MTEEKQIKWEKAGDYEEVATEFLCPNCKKELFIRIKRVGKQNFKEVNLINKEYKR